MNELDIFNPQVSTVAKGLEGKVILVYGGNNLGKTKQATRMKKPFYLPFEAGLNAIPGVPYCPITKWSDFIKINKQLTDQDTKTDALIRKAFREEIPNTTKIIIAQRVSSIEDADQIIVLDDGKISGIGTSEELLKTNDIYREVYESQVKGGEDDE